MTLNMKNSNKSAVPLLYTYFLVFCEILIMYIDKNYSKAISVGLLLYILYNEKVDSRRNFVSNCYHRIPYRLDIVFFRK